VELPAGHKDKIQALMFSPADDSLLVSGGEDGLIKVWNVEEGCEAQTASMPVKMGLISTARETWWQRAAG
jgi:WD40 repeat protein